MGYKKTVVQTRMTEIVHNMNFFKKRGETGSMVEKDGIIEKNIAFKNLLSEGVIKRLETPGTEKWYVLNKE